jgi:hypothetical protein
MPANLSSNISTLQLFRVREYYWYYSTVQSQLENVCLAVSDQDQSVGDTKRKTLVQHGGAAVVLCNKDSSSFRSKRRVEKGHVPFGDAPHSRYSCTMVGGARRSMIADITVCGS